MYIRGLLEDANCYLQYCQLLFTTVHVNYCLQNSYHGIKIETLLQKSRRKL